MYGRCFTALRAPSVAFLLLTATLPLRAGVRVLRPAVCVLDLGPTMVVGIWGDFSE